MVMPSKKIGGTASALSMPPRIRVIITKLAPHRSSNRRKEVPVTRVSAASVGLEPVGCSMPKMPLVQWPPSGPQVLGEIEKPAVPKMGRRIPTCSKHEGLVVERPRKSELET